MIGTAPYMSPEQARGAPVDRRTDIWAFGCVLFEMLTGRLAFDGNTRSDIVAGILEKEPDWPTLPADTPLPCVGSSVAASRRIIAAASVTLATSSSSSRTSHRRQSPGDPEPIERGSSRRRRRNRAWLRSAALAAAGAVRRSPRRHSLATRRFVGAPEAK